MFISRGKLATLEARIADLEGKKQEEPRVDIIIPSFDDFGSKPFIMSSTEPIIVERARFKTCGVSVGSLLDAIIKHLKLNIITKPSKPPTVTLTKHKPTKKSSK